MKSRVAKVISRRALAVLMVAVIKKVIERGRESCKS